MWEPMGVNVGAGGDPNGGAAAVRWDDWTDGGAPCPKAGGNPPHGNHRHMAQIRPSRTQYAPIRDNPQQARGFIAPGNKFSRPDLDLVPYGDKRTGKSKPAYALGWAAR